MLHIFTECKKILQKKKILTAIEKKPVMKFALLQNWSIFIYAVCFYILEQ